MALTLPTIAPVAFGTTAQAFNEAPGIRNGSPTFVEVSIAVPASTASGTLIGVVPFRQGARINYVGNDIYIGTWDTSTNVTFTVGYTYYDSATGSSSAAAFLASSTTGQSSTGGFVSFNVLTGFQFIALGDGWLTITTAGGSTTTASTIQGEICISYNNSPVLS